MQKVKFVEDAEVTTTKGIEKAFTKGQVVELNEASADRWLRRGKCVFIREGAPTRKKRTRKKKTTRKKAAAKKA